MRMIAEGASHLTQPRLELDTQKQQLPEIQQQRQPGTAAGMGLPAAALPFPGGYASAPLVGLAPLVSVGSNKHLPDISQQQQADTAAEMGSPGAAALPFPGGPTLGAWGLGQSLPHRMGMGSARWSPTQSDLVTVYLGREPFVKTPSLVTAISSISPFPPL
jgi:hypothetical protein